MVKSIIKGRRGEQEIGRILYEAWFGSPPPKDREHFIRVGFGRRQARGDLILPPDFPFTAVEVKNRNVPLEEVLEIKGQFLKWLLNLTPPATLIFKHNRKWIVAIVTMTDIADATLPATMSTNKTTPTETTPTKPTANRHAYFTTRLPFSSASLIILTLNQFTKLLKHLKSNPNGILNHSNLNHSNP